MTTFVHVIVMTKCFTVFIIFSHTSISIFLHWQTCDISIHWEW